MDLKSAQFEAIFGITKVESYGIVGHSYDHCFVEHS